MLGKSLRWIAAAAVVLWAGAASAVPISEVIIGARYSVDALFENRTAVAKQINVSTGQILVQYDDNARTEWVSASKLLRSYGDSVVKDTEEAIMWAGAAAAVANALSSPRDQYIRSSRFGPSYYHSNNQINYVYIKNECHKAVRLWLVYMQPNGNWSDSNSSWDLHGYQSGYIGVGAGRLRVMGDNVFIYAESNDRTGRWGGDPNVEEGTHNWYNPEIRAWMGRIATTIDGRNNRSFSLEC